MAAAGLISLFVSLPALRLHGDYFVIATFGFQMILFSIFNNWMAVTRGPFGIMGIPRPVVFGWTMQSQGAFLVVSAIFAVFAYLIVRLISSSPFGRVLRGIRED